MFIFTLVGTMCILVFNNL